MNMNERMNERMKPQDTLTVMPLSDDHSKHIF